ncbi:sigma-70 family RNA polymerase sigma factor [Neolewinella lacunae]|uniref:Sigma-70 family RNA polymerase sigma factor n=1 Tax=Neolewinella lacunae TaxID=1517758 RepID=A0A923PKF9_9BACT|nr:sigma-70 family RNA polymerase sigma factor [Neolewinella lacunae]MBC6992944.1 sigma-70 family RNA polymerase sigma factor [Neolewinella lacunae]MDN3633692.1 sigma-70 family RNA polymerase sigma factor [Neolewinella lacunae]
MSNPELLDLLREDTRRALTWIVSAWKDRCIAFALKSVIGTTEAQREEKAQQLFSDALIALVDNVQAGRLTTLDASLGTYLNSTMKFIHWGEQRKAKRPPLGYSYEEEGINEEIEAVRSSLRRHLRELGAACRQIITFFYFDKLSFAEILELTKGHYESVAVLRNKKSKCMKQLRENIGVATQTKKSSSNA